MKVGLLSMLTVLFVGLKLTGYITWSWWLVTAPTWLPLTFTFGFIFLAWLVAMIFLFVAWVVS